MDYQSIHTDDLEEIASLQPEGWPDIIPCIKYYIESSFCSPLKLKVENKLVGIGAHINYPETGWLAHIIVSPEYRNQGIGRAITQKLVDDAYTGDVKTLSLIATELGESIYKKVGFRAVSEYKIFQREKPWLTREASDSITPFDEKHLPQLFKMDADISGEDRKALLADHLHSAVTFIDGNKILGCYLPVLGEGMIIANDEKAGLELMQVKYAQSDKAVLPSENSAGIDFLKGNGFKEVKSALRMCIGEDLNWHPEKLYSRIGGNFG